MLQSPLKARVTNMNLCDLPLCRRKWDEFVCFGGKCQGLYEYRDMTDDITGIYHLTDSGLFVYEHCEKYLYMSKWKFKMTNVVNVWSFVTSFKHCTSLLLPDHNTTATCSSDVCYFILHCSSGNLVFCLKQQRGADVLSLL